MTPELINTPLCLALFWTSFCRLVHTDESTYLSVRTGLWLVAASALAAAVAPWVWEVRFQWFSVAIAASVLVLQLSTSRFWRSGVPAHLQRRSCNGL